MGGWFRKPINTVEDLKGLKMRIGGFPGRVLQKLGAVPQQIAGGDIYPALEKGTIDAAEWVGPYDDEKLGFYKVAPYYYTPGWWEGGSMITGFVNLDKWNALPKAYRAALENAAAYANQWCLAKYDQANPPALRRLIAGGARLSAFSPAIMEACFKAAMELHAEISKDNAAFKKVNDSMMTYTKTSYQWFSVAELNYDVFMTNHMRG
jgi:TRAP-type mannitol/chloroaromatic compound transport system substrate-binding protein